jgi:NhaA family Na+:H+ antiporter
MSMISAALRRFLGAESAGGVLLALAALLGLALSNSSWAPSYEALRLAPGEIRIGGDWLVLAKPAVVWINDLWMAVFFFLVGLEIKREFLAGELSSRSQVVLPAVAALGGMTMPALVFALINQADPVALRGWAIPAATDIAFALGVLMLLGSRVPVSLKVFLTAVAIIDDLGAIVVIALFYTAQLSLPMLLGAAACLGVLGLLNRARVGRVEAYVLVGLVMWVFVLKSGVHATLAGVFTALAVPMRDSEGGSPLQKVEHGLHPWVAFAILPCFAFANAGVSLAGVSLATLLEPLPLGIAGGLVVGKAAGIFGSIWGLERLGWSSRPQGANWTQCFGVALLCGIGFTMSLFIGGLAFAGMDPAYETRVKLGVLAGSVLAGCLGALVLWRAGSPMPDDAR